MIWIHSQQKTVAPCETRKAPKSRDGKLQQVIRCRCVTAVRAMSFQRSIFDCFVRSGVKWLTGWLSHSFHWEAIPPFNRCHCWENLLATEPTFSATRFPALASSYCPQGASQTVLSLHGDAFWILGNLSHIPLSHPLNSFTCGEHQVLNSFAHEERTSFS